MLKTIFENVLLLVIILNSSIRNTTSKEYTGRFSSKYDETNWWNLFLFQLFSYKLVILKRKDYLNHTCIRECSASAKPMICEYDWTLELYSTMSRACYECPKNLTDCLRENCILADGFIKSIEVINRLMPGPSIQVCKGDTVVVNLENRLRSERVTSIHWHGIKQKDTPYMDGVSMVTQCPIVPQTSFQYKFVASEAGTHFWHAHSGAQRAVCYLIDSIKLYF